MVDHAFLDDVYDQASHGDGPRRLLFVCTTPRTGSNRVGSALYDLGCGVQAEYFHPNSLEVLGARWGVTGDRRSPVWLDAYWQEVLRRRTRNGVVAVSIFGFQLAILRRLIQPGDQAIFVHLHRRSAVDQIASLLALYQTKMPYEDRQMMANIPDVAEISPRAIRILHQWLAQQNRKWRDFLADKPHLTTSSEDFFREPAVLLREILAHSGIVVSSSDIDAAARRVREAGAHSINAALKRQLIEEHAAGFAALRPDVDNADALVCGQGARRPG